PTAEAPPSHLVTPGFGRPSPAHRQTVAAPWPTVTEVLRDWEDSVWIGPNSAVVHGAGGGRTLVVVAPVGPERTELMAWSELLGDADADTPDALARRRLLGDIVACCEAASNGAPESTGPGRAGARPQLSRSRWRPAEEQQAGWRARASGASAEPCRRRPSATCLPLAAAPLSGRRPRAASPNRSDRSRPRTLRARAT